MFQIVIVKKTIDHLLMSKISYFFIVFLFLLACKGYHTPDPVRIVGSQKEFQHFHATSNPLHFFVLENRKISFLDMKDSLTLNLTSALPLELDFEKVAGNKDTLFVQTADDLKIMHSDVSTWQEIGAIKDLKPCDSFLPLDKYIVVAKGNSICRTSSERPSFSVYNIEKPEVPVVADIVIITNSTGFKNYTLQRYQKTIFVTDPADGLTIYELSEVGKLVKLANYPTIKSERIAIFEAQKIAIAQTSAGITQYSLADLTKIKELSSVK
jgi:hypothetical protein